MLTERCVAGITANAEQLRRNVDHSIGTVTALNPFIGYTAAPSIATEALSSGRGVRELALERELLTAQQLDALLRPDSFSFSATKGKPPLTGDLQVHDAVGPEAGPQIAASGLRGH